MANWYVYSGAAGAGTGADWTNAYTSLLTAMAAKAAGDVFFVAHDHNQAPASALSIVSNGTEAIPCRIYCVNRAGSVPPVNADLRTTAQITTVGNFVLGLQGSVSECYGIIFTSGGFAASALSIGQSNRTWRCVNCSFNLSYTVSGTPRIGTGASGAYVVLENCTFSFGHISQAIVPQGRVTIRNTSATTLITGATIPNNPFQATSTAHQLLVEGVDLSNIASSTWLYGAGPTAMCSAVFKDCKLGAGVIIFSGTPVSCGTQEVTLLRVDSGDTNYRTERWNYMGTQLTSTTTVRTGGATDGTTPISWNFTNLTKALRQYPYESLPITVWNEVVGSAITVTVYGANATSIPTNADTWIEVQYLGTSGFCIASKATSKNTDYFSAGTAYTSDTTSTWSGSPAAKWSMSVTFTPREKGPLTVYIKHSGSDAYFDPKPVIT